MPAYASSNTEFEVIKEHIFYREHLGANQQSVSINGMTNQGANTQRRIEIKWGTVISTIIIVLVAAGGIWLLFGK